jgi:hypothetical protein
MWVNDREDAASGLRYPLRPFVRLLLTPHIYSFIPPFIRSLQPTDFGGYTEHVAAHQVNPIPKICKIVFFLNNEYR